MTRQEIGLRMIAKALARRWPHARPHMQPSDKELAEAILDEVQRVFGKDRKHILTANLKFNEARYTAMELFPWSLRTTAAFFGVEPNSVSWARTQLQNWADCYPKLKAKVEPLRAKLGLPTFPRLPEQQKAAHC